MSSRIKHFRKPKSMVKGDVFPAVITKYCDFFAIPLSDIYNEIASTGTWPTSWKTEYVTVIPKNSSPETFGELRNISCTPLVSKIMESYVLEWVMQEMTTKNNQYGGVRGCSGTHMVLKIWQKILQNLEDRRAATVLTSIDYAKAFNRLSFQHCLKTFAAKGASGPILSLLAAFLTDRTMTVRVGNCWSQPKPVTGGCPQGSILGVFLFNVTTDDLEDSSEFVSDPGAPCPEIDEAFHTAPADVRDAGEDGPYPDFGWHDSDDQSSEESFHSARSRMSSSTDAGSPIVGRPTRRVVYSSEEDLPLPPEPTTTCLGQWRPQLIDVDKYVDDNLQEERVSMENAPRLLTASEEVRLKHAVASQNVFRHIVRAAESKGMRVNAAKTTMVCISDALNFRARAFIEDRDGVRIESGAKMKLLGWHFSDKPTPALYLEVLKRRFRERYWTLRHLKHNGFTEEDLVRVYTAVLRPVADYMQEIYHSMITDRQDEELERLQTHALRCIYGPGLSGRRLRERAELPTLRERRIEACDKFAGKCARSDRFEHWFPKREGRRSARRGDEYVEEYARCDRLYNSPLFYMRRRLNGKEGRTYGSRNKEYRED